MSDAKSAAIQKLIESFQQSGARELHLKCDDVEIYLSTDAAGSGIDADVTVARPEPRLPAAVPAKPSSEPATSIPSTAAVAAAPEWPGGAKVIRAPFLGTFYRAPKPGAASFVEVGSAVSTDSELCLVEVMKLFTTLRAGVAGKVHAILAKDGALVEAEQALFVVMPS